MKIINADRTKPISKNRPKRPSKHQKVLDKLAELEVGQALALDIPEHLEETPDKYRNQLYTTVRNHFLDTGIKLKFRLGTVGRSDELKLLISREY